MIDWLLDNWLLVAIPLLAFLATYIVGLWVRRMVDGALDRWKAQTRWAGVRLVATTLRRSILYWFLLLAIAIGVQVSTLPADVKGIISKVLGSLLVISLAWATVRLVEHLVDLSLPRPHFSLATVSVVTNAIRITAAVMVLLALFDIWGWPTSPLLLLLAILMLAVALALRNAVPNVFAGFQLGSNRQVNVGDYIKLNTGEEGYVTEMGWNTVRIRGLDESAIIIPNSRLVQSTIINYGHPLRKARSPFRFDSRTDITELTGLKARNLTELGEILAKAPDSVVYHHTHHFLEQHHYLTPEPSNDFGVWVSNTLGDTALGERLSAVDTFAFPNLGALRNRLVEIIAESAAEGYRNREAWPGEEFHFMKSVSVILPTPYVAHDLREFVETLRLSSLGSLFFHIFESRLRLGRGQNDFSVWLRDSLGETELADEAGRLDPYTYTLEGLRSALIQLIEKRIK